MSNKLPIGDLVADEYAFQEMCLEILTTPPDCGNLPGIHPYGHSEVYGRRGEKQFGADLIARRADKTWDVGQCKHQVRLSAPNVRDASEAFLQYWESHWREDGVARFILFASCESDSRSLQDEVRRMCRQFDKLGVCFELWGAERISRELLKREKLYQRYERTLTGYAAGERAACIGYEKRLTFLSTSAEELLESIRIDWENRPRSDIFRDLETREKAAHEAGEHGFEARLLRLRATLLIDAGEQEEGRLRNMLGRARQLAPGEDANARLEARILAHEGRLNDAISLLEKDVSERSIVQRAGLLLQRAGRTENEVGRLEDLDLLRRLLQNPQLNSNADARRLEAVRLLYAIGQKAPRYDRALRIINEALEIRETWSARYVKGMILFWLAMPPAIHPPIPEDLPPPSACELLLPTEEAKAHLVESATIFEKLTDKSDLPTLRDHAAIWRLVALAALDNSSEEVTSLAQTLVSASPPLPVSVLYALELAPNLDLSAIRREVDHQIALGGELASWRQLAFHPRICSIDDRDVLDRLQGLGKEVLDESADASVNLKPWWLAQMTKRLLVLGRREEAVALQTHAEDDQKLVDYLRFLCAGSNAASIGQLIVESSMQEDPLALMIGVEALLDSGRVDEASRLVPKLITDVGTLRAFRISLRTTYRANDPERALQILGQWPQNSDATSVEDESIRIWALQQMGQIREALERATKLAARDGLAHHEMMQVWRGRLRILVQVGTEDESSAAALKLAEEFDARLDSVDFATFSAQILATGKSSHRDQARRLLLSILDKELSDDQLLLLLHLGHQLNLDAISKKIVPMLPRLAERRPDILMMADLEDTVAYTRERGERISRLEEQWRKAEIPVHLLAAQGIGVLPRIYHAIPAIQEKQTDFVPGPIPAFHGSRSARQQLPKPSVVGPLAADVTALLLAEHLDILDVVVDAFGAVQLPARTPELLSYMRHQLVHPQPERLALLKRVVCAVDSGNLKLFNEERDSGEVAGIEYRIWKRHRSKARELGANFFPGAPAHRPPDDIVPIIRRQGLLSVLRDEVDHATWEAAVSNARRSDRLDSAPEDIVPLNGSKIVTDSIVLHELAEQPELFSRFLSMFEVWIPERELQVDRKHIREATEQESLRRWVGELRDKVSRGLRSDPPRFALEPSRKKEESNGGDGLEPPEVSYLLDLEDLLKGRGNLWSDDRHVNRLSRFGQIEIFSTLDIIFQMFERGHLDDARYYALLLRLRRGGFQFIPLSKNEISFHLQRARIEEEAVIETSELATLRRTFAASIASSSHLQLHSSDGPDRSELFHFAASIQEIVDAFLVRSNETDTDGMARFVWLLQALFVEEGYISELLPQKIDIMRASAFRVATAARLLVSVIHVLDRERQKQHAEFFWGLMISHWFDCEPNFRGWLSQEIHEDILSILCSDASEAELQETARQIAARFYVNLPDPLRESIRQLFGIPEDLGVKITGTLVIEKVGSLDQDRFVDAISGTLSDGKARVLQATDGAEITVEARDGHVQLSCGDVRKGEFVDEFFLAACTPDPAAWRSYCSARARDLDRTAASREIVLQALYELVDQKERIATWRAELQKTEQYRLQEFESILAKERTVAVEAILPAPVPQMIAHLRIEESEASTSWESLEGPITQRLIDDLGVEETFFRLCGLPGGLPSSLTDALKRLRLIPANR